MKPRQIFVLIVTLLLVIILLQNTAVININILFWQISMSQIILLFIVSIFSFLIGFFTHLIISKQKNQKLRKE